MRTGFLFAIIIAGGMTCQWREAGMVSNPILPGFFPDPSVCRVGDDYYVVNSTFEYFPGVPVSRSSDLVHWTLIGYCLTRESQLRLENVRASGGIYAPTIRYHDGTFYMVTTCVGCGENFYVTAKDPSGPWSEPVWLDKDGFDPSLFFDDDGTVYYTRHGGSGEGYIVQSTLNLATGKLGGDVKTIWGGTGGACPEGPHLYKIHGMYYLMIAEGGTDYYHAETIARSDSPWGPFESCPANPILTHRLLAYHPIQSVGHADLVKTPDGWWLVCLGIRPQGGRFHHIGRETFLAPVAFNEAGWPVVNGNGTIPFEIMPPKLREHAVETTPLMDDFDAPTLALVWNHLRKPNETAFSLTARPGYLRLHGLAEGIGGRNAPVFVGRRQTDFVCEASALLEFDPENGNGEAGLVIRQTDDFHYDIGVRTRNGRREVFFRKVIDAKVVDSAESVELPPGPVILSITAAHSCYEFSYRFPSGTGERLGTASTKDLSVERIERKDGMCFTGVFFGMYATGNGTPCEKPADFDWFEYRGGDGKRN